MSGLTSVGPGGRYVLDSRIATGGMGEVWRATDSALGRQVAVKVMRDVSVGEGLRFRPVEVGDRAVGVAGRGDTWTPPAAGAAPATSAR